MGQPTVAVRNGSPAFIPDRHSAWDFFGRAWAFFASYGIEIELVLTDNGGHDGEHRADTRKANQPGERKAENGQRSTGSSDLDTASGFVGRRRRVLSLAI